MSILNEIIAYKREELKSTISNAPVSDLKSKITGMEPVRNFRDAIRRKPGEPINLIAELKKCSPSKGLIREEFSPSKIISIYDRKDVAAVSVLTEQRYFGGRIEYLSEARKRTGKPLLRKDFIFDEYQVYEARAHSADAILLIVAALEKSQLRDLFEMAKELSLASLVEVHNWKELDAALYCGAEIIGINNRDLRTLDISLTITFSLLKDIPDDRIVVSESGISTRSDVQQVESTRADAVLVGTTIMKADDIGSKIDELRGRS